MHLRILAILISSFLISPVLFDRVSSAYQESTVYSCSMHPEVQSSKPGKCPKCGMKLLAQRPSEQQKPTANQTPAAGSRILEVVKQVDQYTCSMHPEIRT